MNFKHPSSHCLESSPGELNKIQNSIGGDSVHSYTVSWCPLESAGLPSDFLLLSSCFWWTLPAGLVTFRRTHQSGKHAPESHRKIAAPPELKIQHSGWVESDGVHLESARKTRGSVKTSFFQSLCSLVYYNLLEFWTSSERKALAWSTLHS